MTLGLRALRGDDVSACAGLHRTAFPGFFLSQLGEPFLREFYRAFVEAQDGIAIVAVDEADIVQGVVVGTTQPAGFFRRILMTRWWAFGLASIGLALRRPRHIPRLLRAVLYRGENPVEVSGALLSSICVDPRSRGGVGSLLIDAFVQRAAELGRDGAYLTTDASDNDRVNQFYRLSGWRLAGTYQTPEGRAMNCYRWSRPAEDAHATDDRSIQP